MDKFDEKIKYIKNAFKGDDTFEVKSVKNQFSDIKIAVLLSNCMINNSVVNRDIIAPLCTRRLDLSLPLSAKKISACAIDANSAKFEKEIDNVLYSICAGDCAVLIDGCDEFVILDVKGMGQRSVSTPDEEYGVTGPAEAFNENLMTSLSMIKKRLSTPRLKNEIITLGRQTQTKTAIIYLEGVVKPKLVEKIKNKLNNIDVDVIFDTNYIAEIICGKKQTFFKTYGKTQRTDVLCSKLAEGRIGIMINGSPIALTLPYIFIESFQTPDDYYLNYYYANIGRLLRFLSFLIATILPGAYLSLICFNQNLLPARLLFSISGAQNGVPFSSLFEMLLLLFAFEILREAGARLPDSVGLAVNVVGSIVLGQSAVEAKLVSASMVIVVAFCGICSLMIADVKGAVIYVRIYFILLGATLGLLGIFCGFIFILSYLANLNSLGTNYLYTLNIFLKDSRQDTVIRVPIPKMNRRQNLFSNNKFRQKIR